MSEEDTEILIPFLQLFCKFFQTYSLKTFKHWAIKTKAVGNHPGAIWWGQGRRERTPMRCQTASRVLQQPCKVMNTTLIFSLRKWKHSMLTYLAQSHLGFCLGSTHSQVAPLPDVAANIYTQLCPTFSTIPQSSRREGPAPREGPVGGGG